jgi:hypothetical protein
MRIILTCYKDCGGFVNIIWVKAVIKYRVMFTFTQPDFKKPAGKTEFHNAEA